MTVRYRWSMVACLVVAAACLPLPAVAGPQLLLSRTTAPGQTTVEALPPGAGLAQVIGGGRVIRSQVIDPSAPLRVIVALDAEPAGTARLRGMDASMPRRRLDLLRADLAKLAGAPGGAAARITREYTEAFSGAAVSLAPELLPRLRALPYVRGVFPDDTVHATLAQSVPLIRADRVRTELGGTGAGIRVGIIDTGIDYNHPAFGGGFGPGHRVAGGYDFVNGDADPRDDQGHGTHVAGIVAGNGGGILGVAPQATLYAFKVLNALGFGYDSDILAALDRVLDPDGDPTTDDALQVINLSLGGAGNADSPLSVALDHLTEAGVVCVVAAGNTGAYFGIGAPGASRRAITVGASTKSDVLASFSSLGPVAGDFDLKPDLVAPGENIVSAAMGGGVVALSGTSMAAPHVAGVAAQLTQLHPGWSVDQLEGAIVGTAVDLHYTAFQQGAGRVDAYAAATATFSVSPSHVSFGRVDPSATTWSRFDTLHVTNLTAAARSVSFPSGMTITSGATLTVNPPTVTLAAGAKADVVLGLSVVNASVPYPPDPPYGYDAVVVAASGTERHRIPVSFHKAASLTVHAAQSAPTMLHWVIVHDRRPNGFAASYFPGPGDVQLILPPGNYDVMGAFYLLGPFIIHENVPVSGDMDMILDPAEATLQLGFENVDEHGAPAACNLGSFSLFHQGSKWGFGYLGFPFGGVLVNPTSSAYQLEWTRTQTNGRDQRHSFSGAVSGFSTSQTFTNRPEDLHHLVIDVPSPAAPSAAPLFWELSSFRLFSGYFGVALFDTTIAPITGPFAYDWWLMTAPYPGHLELGARLDLFPWDHGYLKGSRWLMMTSSLRLDRGWPIQGYYGDLYQPRTFTFGGEHMRLGVGAPVWRGSFVNSSSALGLDCGSPSFPSHLVTDAYGTIALEPDPPFRLSQDGTTVLADTLHGAGDISYQGSFQWPVPPGLYTFQTSRPFTVGGQPARLDVTTLMDTRLADPDPPSLRSMQVFADSEVTDLISFPAAAGAGVRFRVTDHDSLSPANLWIRSGGAGAWAPLPVRRDSDTYVAQLPTTLDGPVALRLRAADAAGNALTLVWDPAFFAWTAAGVTFEGIGAGAVDGVVQLTWRALPAGRLRVNVERRERTTDWSVIGSTTADDQGNVAYADSTALARHTYGYRLALVSSLPPGASHSDELWITIPDGPALALAGARPNPGPADRMVVEFSLSSSARARLALFDVAGRKIAERDVGALGPGRHVTKLPGWESSRAGIYFLRLSQDGRSLTSRICLLK